MSGLQIWLLDGIQLLAFGLMFVRRTARPYNIPLRIWIIVLLLIVDVSVVVLLSRHIISL